jgi:hypothetical protein
MLVFRLPAVSAENLAPDLHVAIGALVDPHAPQLVDEAVPVATARADPGVRLKRHEQLQQVAVEIRHDVALPLPIPQLVPPSLTMEVGVREGKALLLGEDTALLNGCLVVGRDEEDAGCEGVGHELDEIGGRLDESGRVYQLHLNDFAAAANVGGDGAGGQWEWQSRASGEVVHRPVVSELGDRARSFLVEAHEKRSALCTPPVLDLLARHTRGHGEQSASEYLWNMIRNVLRFVPMDSRMFWVASDHVSVFAIRYGPKQTLATFFAGRAICE